jgi:anti-sigma factor RsiW
MTCSQSEHQINALLDGELSASQLGGLFRHLGECSRCQAFFLEHQTTIDLVNRTAPPVRATPPMRSGPRRGSSTYAPPFLQGRVRVRAASIMLSALAAFMLGMGCMLGLASLDRLGHADRDQEGIVQGTGIETSMRVHPGRSFSLPLDRK